MLDDETQTGRPADDLVGALGKTRLFSTLDRRLVKRLAQAIEPLTVRAGEAVITEGETGDTFYVVRSGLLEVVTGPNEERVRLLRAGVPFGELALLGSRARTATIRALRDSEVWCLPREHFDELLASEADFARTMVRALTQLVFESRPQQQRTDLSVIAIAPLHPDSPARSVVEAFKTVLAPGTVYEVCPQSDATKSEWAAMVEAVERDHDVVLLVASHQRDDWFDFCVREADRIVAVADRAAAIAPLDRTLRADLILFGANRDGAVGPIVARFEPRAHHLVDRNDQTAGLGRAVRRITDRSIGIVLSGGGARGFAHIGVLQALADAGVIIDRFAGVSMGSLVGALAARQFSPAQISMNLRRELVDRRPFSDYGVPRISLIRANRARAMLDRLLGPMQIEELAHDFFCVSADLVSAEPVVHRSGSLVIAVGASMSLPGLAPPLRDGPRILVDGGVLDNLPVETMIRAESGPVIAVDVMGRSVPGARRSNRKGEQLPSLLETVARSTTLASRGRAEVQRELATLAIVPELRDVGLLDFARFDRVVEAGRRAAEEALVDGQKLLHV
jgi:predicted acylesterase/phospholipase RssA/CRP-like cAMP-binding protein